MLKIMHKMKRKSIIIAKYHNTGKHMINQLLLLLLQSLLCLVLTLDLNAAEAHRNIRAAITNNDSYIHNNNNNNNLINLPACSELRTLCAHQKTTDNLSVLECVHTFGSNQLEALADECQNAIWQQQYAYLTTQWLQQELLLQQQCSAQHDALLACTNSIDMWPCLHSVMEHLEYGNSCRTYLRRVSGVLFPDYQTLSDFFSDCPAQVAQHSCGRLNVQHKSISQLETVQCLQEAQSKPHTLAVPEACQTAMTHVQMLSTDLKFFEICANDLQRLCGQEKSGTTAGFKCLVKHKNHPSLSRRCAEQISLRDRELGKDYRVSHGLAKSCKDDIKLHHCRRGVSEDKHVRLAQILLCLESVAKNGTRLAPECRAEIDDHRRMLMQDYQLSPEILADCADDIPKFCADMDKLQPGSSVGTGGEIIHCLLENARVKRRKDRRVTSKCQRSLEALIKVSDVGEDWRVDPILRRACKPVVDAVCTDIEGGEARVMSCLMEHLDTPHMRPDCAQALLLIQYFVARDFKLDPQLYKHCHDDAVKYCNAKNVWDDVISKQMDPERGPLILPCLHRIAYSEASANDKWSHISLRKDCVKEVKRVMRQRAVSVDLMPEIEDVCIEDLSFYCYDRTERGAEMECLQTNLEKLAEPCKKAITAFTEEEAAHVDLNPVIMSVCSEAMNTHCSDKLRAGSDKGDLMDCLISHKNDADLRQDLKCRAAIEHFQIISLKNYHFTYKFKEACRPYVARFCAASTTKNDVVACLSEVMRNETIRGIRHTIPKECRQQVRAQLYQQRETLALDPKLANACKHEMEEYCSNAKGPGQAIECLTQNTAKLSNACHHAIFLVKRSELGDSATDYTLVNTCREMTYKFCARVEPIQLLDCLKTYKDHPMFDKRCHLVVVNRMIEQNTDFRFNPTLQLACGNNIDKYCSDIVGQAQPNEELNGKVIQCLKNKFRESLLDPSCSQEMIKILQEQALNYKLNPLLQNFCKNEIEVLCAPYIKNEDHGLIEECLKTAFLNQRILNRECKIEVATLIAEAKADIHVDPILEEACTSDLLRYCFDVKSGNGRKLKCLQVVLQDQSKALEEDCRSKLQRRIEMFRNADTVLAQPPENMEQLVSQVVTSPAKKFFFVILLTATGMVFLMGIFLGRFTKRAMNTKNK